MPFMGWDNKINTKKGEFMLDLRGKNVLVTGATSFVAKHLIPRLVRQGAIVSKYKSKAYDLTSFDATEGMFKVFKPDYVIHLAADTKTRGAAETFSNNVRINLNVLECCQKFKVKKTLNVICSATYPDTDDRWGIGIGGLSESYLWIDTPPINEESFGLAKRFGEAYGRALNRQYKTDIVTCCVTDLYGPYDRCGLVGNLIWKIVEAKQKNAPSVEFHESKYQTKDLLYAEDAADLILTTLLIYNEHNLLLNIGSGSSISLEKLAEKIKLLAEYERNIIWNTVHPYNQINKELNVERMRKYLREYPITPLDEGLKKTVAWYLNNQEVETPCLLTSFVKRMEESGGN
jgi:GDP-L-fucose synthase